jgi:hypothetical protein
MTKYILALSVVAMSCGRQTDCGVTTDPSSWVTPQMIEEFVSEALFAGSNTKDPNLKDSDKFCSRMNGIHVRTEMTWAWYEGTSFVDGLAICKFKTIIIGTPDSKKWTDTAVIHELFHVGQDCDAPKPLNGEEPTHSNWVKDGLHEQIDLVKSTYGR